MLMISALVVFLATVNYFEIVRGQTFQCHAGTLPDQVQMAAYYRQSFVAISSENGIDIKMTGAVGIGGRSEHAITPKVFTIDDFERGIFFIHPPSWALYATNLSAIRAITQQRSRIPLVTAEKMFAFGDTKDVVKAYKTYDHNVLLFKITQNHPTNYLEGFYLEDIRNNTRPYTNPEKTVVNDKRNTFFRPTVKVTRENGVWIRKAEDVLTESSKDHYGTECTKFFFNMSVKIADNEGVCKTLYPHIKNRYNTLVCVKILDNHLQACDHLDGTAVVQNMKLYTNFKSSITDDFYNQTYFSMQPLVGITIDPATYYDNCKAGKEFYIQDITHYWKWFNQRGGVVLDVIKSDEPNPVFKNVPIPNKNDQGADDFDYDGQQAAGPDVTVSNNEAAPSVVEDIEAPSGRPTTHSTKPTTTASPKPSEEDYSELTTEEIKWETYDNPFDLDYQEVLVSLDPVEPTDKEYYASDGTSEQLRPKFWLLLALPIATTMIYHLIFPLIIN